MRGNQADMHLQWKEFLRDRYFVAHPCGVTYSRRKVTRGVPQGSVLSNPLLHLGMTAILGAISNKSGFPVPFAIDADDVTVWCAGKSTRAEAIRGSLQ